MAKRIDDDLGDQILRTLADLNETVGNRFDKVDDKFREINSRLDTIDRDLVEIKDTLLKNHESRINRIEEKLGIR